MKQISPFHTLLTILAIASCYLLFSQLMPREVQLGELSMKFFKPSSWFEKKEEIPVIEDVERFLAELDSSAVEVDTTAVVKDPKVSFTRSQEITSLQFKDGSSESLHGFFSTLESIKGSEGKIHILHYGDSQIESDRMTSVLRENLQKEFGGKGPGLICPVPITASAAISQSQSSNWKRYTGYGFADAKATHNDYGIMVSYGRFTPEKSYEEILNSDTTEAWLELKPSGMSAGNCRQYTQLSLLFGNHQTPVEISLFADDSLIQREVFDASTQSLWKKYFLGYTPKRARLVFRGLDSPDVQALLLEGWQGVQVDNIALRGSSGTIFRKIESASLRRQIEDLNTSLIILQFGGNSVPGLKDAQAALNFGSYFKSQIKHLKSLHPDIPIIVIGPSDMSTSIDGEYQTWPFLEELNFAMKQAAFDEECAFWDMFSVMGGRNSMISWVNNDPPYAGPDYTHFTPKGARKMAELFHKALMREYQLWLEAKKS